MRVPVTVVVIVGMGVVVPVVVPVVSVPVVVPVVVVPVVVVPVTTRRRGGHDPPRVWWCRGMPPRECSAW
ncbi:hypothetical protein FB391_3381 [Microbacterium kyungheense]|uniref:Uncharacterized protein n=1 Tax=Microbacterium kyungheense TaxID=1263636 RepID=A0A543EF78_9MICO|nr:hypothetical protein FB391_3381 [Microbacterium kyungheense]